MPASIHSSKAPARRISAKHAAGPTRIRRERRAAHRFQGDPRARSASPACLACGYAEAGHLALTDPEREAIVALVNQPHPQPLMRRSILRKLTAALHHKHA